MLFQPTFSKNIDICEYFEISHKSATLKLNVILKELCDNQQNQLLSIIKDLNLRLMENTYKYCTRTDPLLTFSCLEEIDWTNCCKWRENKVYGFQTVWGIQISWVPTQHAMACTMAKSWVFHKYECPESHVVHCIISKHVLMIWYMCSYIYIEFSLG